MAQKRLHRSDHLLRALRDYDQIVVMTHDTPDPDAIAAGWAVHHLVREKLQKPVQLIGGGAVVRAENIQMLALLRPPIQLVDEFRPEPGTAPVLVDCSPAGANHLLGGGAVKAVAVIDHHVPGDRKFRVRFRDIRPRAAASATIAGCYLREQELEPGDALATALLYAVRTEVIGSHLRFTRHERSIIAWLAERADHQALQSIENAPLSRRYFEDLVLAMGNTFVYGDVAVCFLPQANSAEIVGEVADLLIRCENVHRVFCGAVVGPDLFISARTSKSAGDAVLLLSGTLKGIGHWGGHPNRAGGKVAGNDGQRITQGRLDEIKQRWLRACGLEETRGNRLIARRDLLEIL